jgi:hypothetical protein
MAIFQAIRDGNLSKVTKLLDDGIDPNLTDGPHDYSLLFLSIFHNKFDIFYELINKGADINQPNKLGQTAVCSCAFHGYTDHLYKLLELKANLYQQKFDGSTCISSAIFLKDISLEYHIAYNLIMFADKANKGDLDFIKSEISKKNYVPIKSWFNYLSKESCKELFIWCKPKLKINSLFGKDINGNKTKQFLREQVSDQILPVQIIISYIEPTYIRELRELLKN